MTVTVNAATEDVRTGTTSPHTFSHAGAASGVKGVLLALVHGTSATDHVSAASYGGVAMTRVQRNTDTATEPGAAEWWFLGAGVPQGTQTVSYTPGATTDDIHAVCITLLADGDLAVVDSDGVNENVANPSVTLQYNGRTCMAFGALYGGGASPTDFTPNANCTTVHDHDLGAFYSEIIRQTTAGSSDFAIGGTSGTDDVAFAAIAVSEKVVAADGSVTASASTSVVGAALWNTLSAAAGIAASAVVGATIAIGAGSSGAAGSASGVGAAIAASVSASAGIATVDGIAAARALANASSDGIAGGSGVGQSTAQTDAASGAVAACSGVGVGFHQASAASSGVGSGNGTAAAVGAAAASSSGAGSAVGAGEDAGGGSEIREADGSAAGLGAVSGVASRIWAVVASATSQASVAAEYEEPIFPGEGQSFSATALARRLESPEVSVEEGRVGSAAKSVSPARIGSESAQPTQRRIGA